MTPEALISRRRLLLTAGTTAALLAAAPASASAALATAPDRPRNLLARGASFPDGVSSGTVRTDGATLWTRLAGGGAAARMQLLVSESADMAAPVDVREIVVDPGADGAVHVEFRSGRPGQEYFYRFDTADSASDVGRFRTARPADSTEPTRIGFFTCQSYVDGYFGAHRHLAAEDLDLVVCLGDYIYENGGVGPGGRVDAIGLGVLPYIGIAWLQNYRSKYRLYRTDPALRALHAAHPIMPVYDDHEFRNNWYRDGSLGRRAPVPANFEYVKQAALQAWFENMPVPAGDRTLRRSVRLGRHAELFGYDARSFRDVQPCGDGANDICAEADAPGRTMIGADQKRSLLDGLTGSSATWKVLANQNMMMGMTSGDGGARAYLDTWDGYGAERTEILTTVARSTRDLVVVTGDDHDTFAGELWDTGFADTGTLRAGVEFVVPSVTSMNTGDLRGDAGARDEERNRLTRNGHLKLIDMVQHGYGVLTLSGQESRFDFRRVAKTAPDAPVSTPYSLRVARGSAEIDDA